MADLFPYPNASQYNGIDGMMTYSTEVTDGFMGMFLIFIAFSGITITTMSMTGSFESGVVVGCFGAGLSSIILFGMGIIGEPVLLISGICSASSIIFFMRRK